MAQNFKKLKLHKFSQLEERETPEARFWKKFKSPVLQKQFAPVTRINFCAAQPYDFAIATSTRIVLYSSKTNKVKKQFSRFRDVAYSPDCRSDGKLLVTGGANPIVQVFDMATKGVLRTFKGHQAAIRCTKFSSTNTSILSASDDCVVRYWDLPTNKCAGYLKLHSDYVRSASQADHNPAVWATGSYDHTVKLWDMRLAQASHTSNAEQACTMTLSHGSPVEQVLVLPGGNTMVSAGGNCLKVWDLLSGGKLLHTLSNHQKTIMDVCLDGTRSRMLSAGLDGFVKIYDLNEFNVTHSIKYSAPVLSVACAPDNSRLVAGMTDGMLSIRQKVQKMEETVAEQQASSLIRGGSYKYFLRGQSSTPAVDDWQATSSKKANLKPYEVYLKKFQYTNALNATLETLDPVIVFSMLEELVLRNGLGIALAGRDEETLQPLVAFIVKYITHPRYASLLIDVCNVLFDLYASVVGQSPVIDDLFLLLQRKVHEEIHLEKDLLKLIGCLDLLMASAANAYKPKSTSSAVQAPEILPISEAPVVSAAAKQPAAADVVSAADSVVAPKIVEKRKRRNSKSSSQLTSAAPAASADAEHAGGDEAAEDAPSAALSNGNTPVALKTRAARRAATSTKKQKREKRRQSQD